MYMAGEFLIDNMQLKDNIHWFKLTNEVDK